MASTFSLEYDKTLILMLFNNVTNLEEVKSKLTNSTHPFSNCTIINANLILDTFQILVAANKSVVSQYTKTTKIESLSKSLLFNLSISDNITASLQKFGYSSDNDHLLLAFFETDTAIIPEIISEIHGTLLPLDKICDSSNIDMIKQTYDIAEEHLKSSTLLDLIVSKIACKGL